ncbi:MAG: polysaccharide biosynthesis C-terminal domain-containing protein [Coleofasciculus sp. C1-SOL-03]|uniref:hypothetical protein n=1 Tax=Coleofasciculus sp. C1-SOL-03 TaxID=3069522 RepID=UPI0033042894
MNSIVKITVQVFSFDILSKILLGGINILLIRFMADSEYAYYTLALSIITIFTRTLVSSFNRIYIVGCKRIKSVTTPSSFLGLQLYGVATLVFITFPFQSFVGEIYWFTVVSIVATCLSRFSQTIFQEHLKFLQLSIVELNRTLVFVFAIIVLIYFIRHELKAWQILLLQAIAAFVVFIFSCSKELNLKRMFNVKESVYLAREIVMGEYKYLFGYFLVIAVFSQVDVFVLRAIASDVELATYGSAFRYYSLLLLGLGAVHTVFLPVIQNVKSISELEIIFMKHKRMLLLFVPLVLFSAWISQWVIPWIDMGKYPNAVMVFQILAVSAIISFAFSPHVNIVMRFEDFRFLFILINFALLVNVVLTLGFIPKLGATGAALATLIAFGFVNSVIFLRSNKHKKLLLTAPPVDSQLS